MNWILLAWDRKQFIVIRGYRKCRAFLHEFIDFYVPINDSDVWS
jgi:hypothetical protein